MKCIICNNEMKRIDKFGWVCEKCTYPSWFTDLTKREYEKGDGK